MPFIVSSAFGLFFIWFFGAFIALDGNPLNWPTWARVVSGFLSIAWVVSVFHIVMKEHEKTSVCDTNTEVEK